MDLFTLLFWLAQAMVVAVRLPHGLRARRQGVASSSPSALDSSLLVLANAGMYGLPLLDLSTDWLDWADYGRPVLLGWLGVALLGGGMWLFWCSHRDLGVFWSPSLQLRQGHRVIRVGVYRRIRHPMYAATFLICLAQACLLDNWLAGASGALAFALFYALRIDLEEAMLLVNFGDEYRAMMQQAGRLWPLLGTVRSG